LPGYAITSVRIEGVLHEFSSIPGVKEDTTEIILNLKDLRLHIDSDEQKTLRIEKQGKVWSPALMLSLMATLLS
jgi:DNA-directed RNA polymerase subunit alpha